MNESHCTAIRCESAGDSRDAFSAASSCFPISKTTFLLQEGLLGPRLALD